MLAFIHSPVQYTSSVTTRRVCEQKQVCLVAVRRIAGGGHASKPSDSRGDHGALDPDFIPQNRRLSRSQKATTTKQLFREIIQALRERKQEFNSAAEALLGNAAGYVARTSASGLT